jgi:hypothetical protein
MTGLRKITLRYAMLLLLMMVIAVFGSSLFPAMERWIPAMKQNIFASNTIPKPQIDTQQPKEMATATFAMG